LGFVGILWGFGRYGFRNECDYRYIYLTQKLA